MQIAGQTAPPPLSPPFSVRRRQPEIIKPAKATPHELKKLSDIDDQEGLRFQLCFAMFYNSNPCMKGKDPAGIIRKALGEALVFYYPFAGRLIECPDKKLVVNCNGEGILFVEADAYITIQQLGDSIRPPYPFTEKLLHDVPGSAGILACPLLLIQVTHLACGGFIFAVRLNHTMSDSLGLTQFLNATMEISRGAHEPSLLPIWEREILLNARKPPRITCVHKEYEEVKENNSIKRLYSDKANMVQTSLFFSFKEIKSMRKHLPPKLSKCSTFELLTACLWKCRTMAFQLDPKDDVGVLCMVNLRGKQLGQLVSIGYYGNPFIFPAAVTKAQLLCKQTLAYAIELVKKSKDQISEEYVRSVVDLMVIKGRPHYSTKWNFLVADTSHVGLANIDFGWGKPLYGRPLLAYPDICFFAPFRNSKGENGILVLLCFPIQIMKRFHNYILEITLQSMDDFNQIMNPRIISML